MLRGAGDARGAPGLPQIDAAPASSAAAWRQSSRLHVHGVSVSSAHPESWRHRPRRAEAGDLLNYGASAVDSCPLFSTVAIFRPCLYLYKGTQWRTEQPTLRLACLVPTKRANTDPLTVPQMFPRISDCRGACGDANSPSRLPQHLVCATITSMPTSTALGRADPASNPALSVA